MALIECSECGAQISDKAAVCIKCGAPITAPLQGGAPGQRVVTTEQTGKKYKRLQLLGVVMVMAGVVSCSAHERQWSAGLFMLGMVVFLGARIGAWWDHG